MHNSTQLNKYLLRINSNSRAVIKIVTSGLVFFCYTDQLFQNSLQSFAEFILKIFLFPFGKLEIIYFPIKEGIIFYLISGASL